MRRNDVSALVGCLLVAGGLALLLPALGIVAVAELFFAALFGLAGATFLAVFIRDRARWWAVIPAGALLGLGLLLALQWFSPALGDTWGGSLFLGALGIAFAAVYLDRRERWWAIIPGGVLLTLAVVAAVDRVAREPVGGSLFFLGLALTFVAVYPGAEPAGPGARRAWALYPAGASAALAVLTLTGATNLFTYVWALGLIAAGLYLGYRALREQRP
jgi:hypothetical protein